MRSPPLDAPARLNAAPNERVVASDWTLKPSDGDSGGS
jgi:hypothetical protein